MKKGYILLISWSPKGCEKCVFFFWVKMYLKIVECLLLKFIFLKKTEEYQFCELILFSQTPERNLPWCFSWKTNTFNYKSEEVTCTVDGWMLWACLHTSNFFQAESLFWNVGDSVYYYYTHACMLTPAGKLVCCYLCGHGLTLKLSSLFLAFQWLEQVPVSPCFSSQLHCWLILRPQQSRKLLCAIFQSAIGGG